MNEKQGKDKVVQMDCDRITQAQHSQHEREHEHEHATRRKKSIKKKFRLLVNMEKSIYR